MLGRQLPSIVTPPPGPRSRALAETLAAHEAPITTTIASGDAPIVWREAIDCNVVDADGNVYVDLTAGFGAASVGHANEHVGAAVRRQSRRLVHGLGDLQPNVPRAKLALKLSEITPAGLEQAIVHSTGSEAVEAALKSAAVATGRQGVVAFSGAYHGVSIGALAVSARDAFRAPFARQVNPLVVRAPYANCYRCPLALRYPDCGLACVEETANLIDTYRQTSASTETDLGAMIVEPIQGRGGEVIPPPGYLPALRRLCSEKDLLLIVDEVFTGVGRTGRWFACDHEGVRPELLAMGKGLADGYPISACVGTTAVMDGWRAYSGEAIHTSTFQGHPIGAAAALATIEQIERRHLIARAASEGRWLLDELRALQDRHKLIGDARGLGLLAGLELVADRQTKEPAADLTWLVTRRCRDRGVLLAPSGDHGNVLSFSPPLTIPRALLRHALRVLDGVLTDLENGRP